jgi:Fe-S-cluster containining protein
VDFTFPANIQFDCNGCGLCCGDTQQKNRHILLLETEAKRITAQTSQSKADFCVPINGKLPYSYEMKKTSGGKCIFLKQNRCTIYSLRPLICRFYPFQMTFDKDKDLYVFDFTVECPQINQGKIMSGKEFEELFKLAQKYLT